MKQEEWLAEFERAHGRPANQEEIQQVFGAFGCPETQATPNTPVNPIQSPFEGAAPVSNQGQFGGPLPFPEQAKFGGAAPASEQTPFGGATLAPEQTPFGDSIPASEQTQFGGAAPTPEQTPFGGATPVPEQTQFGGTGQAPFGGASPTPNPNPNPNQFQGGTSPYQHQGQAFGQGGTKPQAPVQEVAQAGAPFASYNNAQMQGGYPNNGQLNYQTNSSYMGQGPMPVKKSKKGLIIGLCSLVAVAVLSVLAFLLFAKNPNSIQGKWSATPEVKKEMTSGFKESFTSTLDISGEFFKDVEMIVEVEGNNVKISTSGKVDFKGAAKKLLEGDKSYLNSVENALEYIEERSKWGYLKEIGVEIDVKKGTIDMVLFEGELSEKTHEFLVNSGGNFVMQYNLKYKLVNGTLTVYQNEEDDFKYTFKK